MMAQEAWIATGGLQLEIKVICIMGEICEPGISEATGTELVNMGGGERLLLYNLQ